NMELPSTLEDLDPKFVTRCSLIEIEGVSLPTTTAEHWDQIRSFQARPDDLLICSYPKAGSTWLQETVDMIQNADNLQKCARAPIYKRMHFLDMFPHLLQVSIYDLNNAEARPSPRSLKSHLPVHLLAPSFWEQKCKVRTIGRKWQENGLIQIEIPCQHLLLFPGLIVGKGEDGHEEVQSENLT
ncbi:hypothetical protein Chor_009291, partial [Crotalus horridus]